ncbi:formate dehydrogenase subunit gamma [Skermanella stibiiresistens SB22]|uniref:Formate dehydrogenase subunit gamma n=1 Tax=Skermanella stibiiresistens SB22 TaxID=1385369 RepID=W9H7E1_9PROT|nr:formate dehydrogenase subunit gamma [Skermanella stibiiresistens]EWY39708.1 formate dehydrogenase subunit gamma [Skermanella stibiiresistens SB22]
MTSFLGKLFPAILMAVFLLTTAPAAYAQLDQRVSPASPSTKEEVELYEQLQGKLSGYVSIPDGKLATLVQPEGREWRDFRNYYGRIISAVMMLGMLALLGVFYLFRGKIRIAAGRAGRTVTRFMPIDRFAHWLTATSFMILALTGLVLSFGRPLLIPVIGHEAFTALSTYGKYSHNFLSFPFVLGVLLMLVLWIKDNIPEKADITWIKQGGGFLNNGSHPEAGRFNAGQKMIFWTIILGGLAMAVSGYMLMFPFYLTGVGGMQISHIVHLLGTAVMVSVIFGHIYIGTVGMEGAFDAMGNGEVDLNWAREHHAGWLKTQGISTDTRDGPSKVPTGGGPVPGLGQHAGAD